MYTSGNEEQSSASINTNYTTNNKSPFNVVKTIAMVNAFIPKYNK